MQNSEEEAGVIAQPPVVYSDKYQTFQNVIRAFGMALFKGRSPHCRLMPQCDRPGAWHLAKHPR